MAERKTLDLAYKLAYKFTEFVHFANDYNALESNDYEEVAYIMTPSLSAISNPRPFSSAMKSRYLIDILALAKYQPFYSKSAFWGIRGNPADDWRSLPSGGIPAALFASTASAHLMAA